MNKKILLFFIAVYFFISCNNKNEHFKTVENGTIIVKTVLNKNDTITYFYNNDGKFNLSSFIVSYKDNAVMYKNYERGFLGIYNMDKKNSIKNSAKLIDSMKRIVWEYNFNNDTVNKRTFYNYKGKIGYMDSIKIINEKDTIFYWIKDFDRVGKVLTENTLWPKPRYKPQNK